MTEKPLEAEALAVPARNRIDRQQLAVVAVVAAGGALGALARYLTGEAIARPASAFPVATLLINTSGCVLIGVLMVVVERALRGQVYVRPFLGVGVLGGFTTFSTYAVDVADLAPDRPGVAVADLLVTPAAALAGVVLGTSVAAGALRLLARTRTPGGDR